MIFGLINVYIYVVMVKFRGFGEDMLIEEWLEKIIWFMEFEWMVGEIREWVRIGIMEVLMNGFIMINDYYFFVDEIVWEVEKMGVRVFIG